MVRGRWGMVGVGCRLPDDAGVGVVGLRIGLGMVNWDRISLSIDSTSKPRDGRPTTGSRAGTGIAADVRLRRKDGRLILSRQRGRVVMARKNELRLRSRL